mgnify:CR=1 FL=1
MAKKKRNKTPWIIATVLVLAGGGFAAAKFAKKGDTKVTVEIASETIELDLRTGKTSQGLELVVIGGAVSQVG